MANPARCTCGYTKFASRIDQVRTENAMRWRQLPPIGGLGSVAVGLALGTSIASWGRYALSLTTGVLSQFCESCARVRRASPVGGGIAMGSWADEEAFYAVMADVVTPSCVSVRFTVPGGPSYDASIELVDTPVLADPGTPLEVRAAPPAGAALATTVYRAVLPEVDAAGTYSVTLRDRCLDAVQLLGSVVL
jgi:hypothetical protein